MKKITVDLKNTYSDLLDASKKRKFNKWLDELEKGDYNDRRLLACIGIDSKFKKYLRSAYIEIFNEVDYLNSVSPSCKRFEDALNKNKNLHRYSKVCFGTFIRKKQYVRIIKLDTFITHFASSIDDYS